MNYWKPTAIALLLFGAAIGHSQDTDAETARLKDEITRLKRDIRRTDADLQRTDSLAHEEADAAAKNLERWKVDRARREKENQELNSRVQATRSKIAAEQERARGYLNGVEELKVRDKIILARLSAFADSLLARVESGPPWDLEARRDRILSLKRDVEGGQAAPEEIFGRLAALFKEEIKNGDEVALFSRPVTRQNGEIVNAQLLKIGNQMIAYMDDESGKFGTLERRFENGKITYVWNENLDFSQRNAIKLALSVKSGREAPQLVPLDIRLMLDSSVTQGGR